MSNDLQGYTMTSYSTWTLLMFLVSFRARLHSTEKGSASSFLLTFLWSAPRYSRRAVVPQKIKKGSLCLFLSTHTSQLLLVVYLLTVYYCRLSFAHLPSPSTLPSVIINSTLLPRMWCTCSSDSLLPTQTFWQGDIRGEEPICIHDNDTVSESFPPSGCVSTHKYTRSRWTSPSHGESTD